MIHHISLPARDPRHVADLLAELLGGRAYPFPGPLPSAWIAVSGDAHGTMIEVYPETAAMAPGEGDAPVVYAAAPPDSRPIAFHALISVPHDRATIEAIGTRVGWRTKFFDRAAPGRPPVFHVIELWVENRILLEIVPAATISIYERYMQLQTMDTLNL